MQYSFYCDCGNYTTIECSMKDLQTPICTCSKEMKRDYNKINVFCPNGRNDASSIHYWKNGKTASQIADVIEGKKQPY